MTLKIACLQMCSSADLDENLAFIEHHMAVAAEQGVRLIQLPENFAQMPKSAASQWVEESAGGKVQDFLADAARRYSMAVIGGALAVRESGQPETKPFARCLVFDNNGNQVAKYDKLHLFNVELPNGHRYSEADRFQAGQSTANPFALVEVEGVRLGLSICYDLRFPEQYRGLTEAGADLLCVPSAFTFETGQAHWQTLLSARAIENLTFVFAAAQTGLHANGRRTWGHSMVINPWGEVLAAADDTPGLLIADIDLEQLKDIRARFPALQHRRL